MDIRDFENIVSLYLEKNGWQKKENEKNIWFEKNHNPDISIITYKNLLSDNNLYIRLMNILKNNNIVINNINEMKNNDNETDFLIAGLQIASDYLNKKVKIERKSFGLVQPVIRLNNIECCGSEQGYISSFVNICSIDIDTNINEYLDRINQWISILSSLSLHSSGLKLILKESTTAFGGIGIEFCYKGIDIGQANLYNIESDGKKKYISDFGFGYERILWILNGLDNFYTPIYPKYEVLYGNYIKNDRIRTSVLIVMSGIIPKANGIGAKLRKIINSGFENYEFYDLKNVINYYYDYYSKFLNPFFSKEEVYEILIKEYINLRKKLICYENDVKYIEGKNIEDICGEIIKKKIRRKK